MWAVSPWPSPEELYLGVTKSHKKRDVNMKPIKMGAIRTNVKLTNAADETLISRGFLAPHLLRSLETPALVDTGALTLVVPQEVVEQLGLRIRRQQIARYANGFEEPSDNSHR